MDNSILDKALGLFSSVQDARKEGRDELMRTILPEVLQPEELKQAEAKPMKEEVSKTLHAPKYDRRMKFNTALERSQNKATSEEPVRAKEEPAWLKEAVDKIAISEGLAIRALTRATEGATDAASAFKAINKYPRTNLRAQGVADPAIRREALPHFKEYTEAASQMSNPVGLTPEMSEDVFSRLFASQNRLGEILGKQANDPAFDFGGVTGREGVVTVEDELERTPPLPTEEPMSYDVANKPVMQKESADTVPPLSMTGKEIEDFAGKNKGYFELAEPTASEKALPVVGGVGMGILPMAATLFNPNRTLLDLGIGGLASFGMGMGTYGLLRHRENKHRARAQAFVDRLNAVSNTPKTAAYPDETETFTQRHPWVLPAGVGLLGAAAGAIPAGLLAGRQAVKSVSKRYSSGLADAGSDMAHDVSAYGRASSEGVLSKEELRELARKASRSEDHFNQMQENKPDLGYHKALGHVGGGTLGGLTGGSLGVLGGLEMNNPQPWEQ